MVIRKRQLVMATLAVALSAAVFVNWYYTKPQTELSEGAGEGVSEGQTVQNLGDAQYVNADQGTVELDVSQEEYFDSATLRRAQAHDEAKKLLESIITNADASDAALDTANSSLDRLVKLIKAEADCEALISAKISNRCIVILGDDNAEVVVGKDALNESIIIQIKEIILTQTSITADKITIIELNG